MNALRRLRAQADAGFTLIELLVASALLVVVLSVVGGILVNTLTVQTKVQKIGSATATTAVVARALDRDVRNAYGFKVDSTGRFLQARVASTTSTGVVSARCVGWYASSVTGGLYRWTSTSAAATLPTFASASSAPPSGWTLMASGVAVWSGATQPFVAPATQLTIGLTVAAGSAHPVVLNTTVTPLKRSDTTTTPCITL